MRLGVALCLVAWLGAFVFSFNALKWQFVQKAPPMIPRRVGPREHDIRVVIARDAGTSVDTLSTLCEGKARSGRNEAAEAHAAAMRCVRVDDPLHVEFVVPTVEPHEYVAMFRAENLALADDQFVKVTQLAEQEPPLAGGAFGRAVAVLQPWLVTAGRPPGIC